MNRSAYTGNRFGLQFDPRTKIVLLILCVISATIASSLLYESALAFCDYRIRLCKRESTQIAFLHGILWRFLYLNAMDSIA